MPIDYTPRAYFPNFVIGNTRRFKAWGGLQFVVKLVSVGLRSQALFGIMLTLLPSPVQADTHAHAERFPSRKFHLLSTNYVPKLRVEYAAK